MAQFYNKYRNLFLSDQQPPFQKNSPFLQQSYVKPYLKQISLDKKLDFRDNSKSFSTGKNGDRFKTEILPQIDRLNKEAKGHRLHTEGLHYNFSFWSPQITKNKNNAQTSIFQQSENPEDRFRKTLKKTGKLHELKFNNRKRMNPYPEQFYTKKHTKEDDPIPQSHNIEKINRIPKQQGHRKTQLARQSNNPDKVNNFQEEQQFQEQYLPARTLKKSEYGLKFSEYERDNQFQFVGKRINDIRRAEQFYPRGYINEYRDALIRRVDAKNNLQERREKLRVQFTAQKILHERHIPIF